MSAKYVRDTFRSFLAGAAFPYVDTINTPGNGKGDPIWFTYEFEAEYYEKDSFCNDFREVGVILVYCSGRPGRGDSAVIDAATDELKRLYGSSDPAGSLELTGILPIEEAVGGDADQNYRVSFGLEYSYSVKL